jgi:hypothetical protein
VRRVGLDEGAVADGDVLDHCADGPHVLLVQKVLVHGHEAELVEQLEILRRDGGNIGDDLKA